MFSLLKFLYLIGREFPRLLDIRVNGLSHIPDPTKYLSMVLLSCFWCLAFGIYIGELLTIGYNMIGHVALITMAFVTWYVFRNYQKRQESIVKYNRHNINWLRMPDRSSRCDEYTDEERERLAKKYVETFK